MKRRSLVLFAVLGGLIAAPSFADELYQIHVYGLNCPYCAYGVQKKIEAIQGVKSVDVDLPKGLVTVRTADGITLRPDQMSRVINAAGFTFHGMTESAFKGGEYGGPKQ